MLGGKVEGITVDREPAEAQNLVFRFIFVANFLIIHQILVGGK